MILWIIVKVMELINFFKPEDIIIVRKEFTGDVDFYGEREYQVKEITKKAYISFNDSNNSQTAVGVDERIDLTIFLQENYEILQSDKFIVRGLSYRQSGNHWTYSSGVIRNDFIGNFVKINLVFEE